MKKEMNNKMKWNAKRIFAYVMTVMLMFSLINVSTVNTYAAAKKKDITLNYSTYTLKKGKKLKLKAKISNKKMKKKKVVWKSSKPAVAKVDQKGVVQAKKNGTTTITATIKGTKKKATCKVTVGTPVKSITLDKKDITLEIGQTDSIKATISPKKASNKAVTYSSMNDAIVEVNQQGTITAKAVGSTKVIVMAQDGSKKKAEVHITVVEKPVVPVTPTPETPVTPDNGENSKPTDNPSSGETGTGESGGTSGSGEGNEENPSDEDVEYTYKLAGIIETFLCDNMKLIQGDLMAENGVKTSGRFLPIIMCGADPNCESYTLNSSSRKETHSTKLVDGDNIPVDMYEYEGYIVSLTEENWNAFTDFVASTITYSVTCDYDVYYKITNVAGETSELKQVENGTISCKNGEVIQVYIKAPALEYDLNDYLCTVRLVNNFEDKILQHATDKSAGLMTSQYRFEPFMTKDGYYIRDTEGDNHFCCPEVQNTEKIEFVLNGGYLGATTETVCIVNDADSSAYEEILATMEGVPEAYAVLELYPALLEAPLEVE